MAVFLYQVGEKMGLIEVQDLYYKYNDSEEWVLNGINLDIKDGEFLVIVGHNGSGKSTLAKMLNGLLVPNQGTVDVNGDKTSDRDKIWDIRQQVGMVFQNPDNQLVANIVEEDIAFGPENLGLESSEIRKRVDNSLKAVAMEEFKRYAPHNLSGGQKQRVAIAGVLAMQPKCLVLDEPTAMLDPVGRKSVMDAIQKLNKGLGMTIVHITHFMTEAIQADRIIVMEEGKIVLEGTPRDIFSQVDKIKEYHLDVPQVTELAFKLHQQGLKISPDIFDIDRLVNKLCYLK
ncbi:energy-coupling factor transport system ATP-binding protein [Orenia metallireducens]|uniref:ABC transporter ATP-binding protein n=2 Tax=Orenia metallireducens TaxID=1413210 RepID=A0A285HA51_9FIRM|nr:energy-coupling factor transporter ATPase [Orenia metallireducens]PRX26233.1 energy-coupling factor transport system ATP-binding protein [Orenia metallireducens]SNY31726.1 energy-coupling factor transport system ATP-binding protein [Orenia metallireducens]